MSGKRRRMLLATGLSLLAPGLFTSGPVLRAAAFEPPAPDPEALMAATWARVVAADTNAALILFIARHPDHELAETARAWLMARPEPDPVPPDGPDGRIIAGFDAARRDGSAAALDGFARSHAGHPLAAEARRPVWRR